MPWVERHDEKHHTCATYKSQCTTTLANFRNVCTELVKNTPIQYGVAWSLGKARNVPFIARKCLSYTIFYKNILDRFWQKIKNFCRMTFFAKNSLNGKKCDVRTLYIFLSYIGKIKSFSPAKLINFRMENRDFLP